MKVSASLSAAIAALACSVGTPVLAQSVYLNIDNMSVSVGDDTAKGVFHDTFANGATISKAIDAASASASEALTQQSHIWFTTNPQASGGLELVFDFGSTSYDLTTLHFWNAGAENRDVDSIALTFYDATHTSLGTFSVSPLLGTSSFAQNMALSAPGNVRYVNALLTGTNRDVEFQNIGFTGTVSAVPEPETVALLPLGLATLLLATRKRRKAHQA